MWVSLGGEHEGGGDGGVGGNVTDDGADESNQTDLSLLHPHPLGLDSAIPCAGVPGAGLLVPGVNGWAKRRRRACPMGADVSLAHGPSAQVPGGRPCGGIHRELRGLESKAAPDCLGGGRTLPSAN